MRLYTIAQSALVDRFAQSDGATFIHEVFAMATTVLAVLLVLMLLGALPAWNHSRSWGYGPSGGLTVILVILLFWMFSGSS